MENQNSSIKGINKTEVQKTPSVYTSKYNSYCNK